MPVNADTGMAADVNDNEAQFMSETLGGVRRSEVYPRAVGRRVRELRAHQS